MNLDEILAQNIRSLDEVEAGHVVFISNSRSYSYYGVPKPVTVDRVTKTQIIISHTRYSRDNGQEIGGSKYASNRVRIPTDGLILEIKVDSAKKALRAMADDVAKAVGIMTNTSVVNTELLDQLTAATAMLRSVREVLP